MLNTEEKTPLYEQLKEIIKNKINNGEYPENTKISSENKLADTFKVSRVTVRKAIKELEEEGYLVSKQGKGTFVKTKKTFEKMDYFIGFNASCLKNGFNPSSIVQERKILKANRTIAEKLNINVGDEILYIQRKRTADNIPVLLENNYFSLEKYGFLVNEDLSGSLYEILKEKNILAENPGKTVLEMVSASNKIAEKMEVPFGTPFFLLETTMSDQNNNPIHAGFQYYLGEAYRFSL